MSASAINFDTLATPSLEWSILPRPRGPFSAYVLSTLKGGAGGIGLSPPVCETDALGDDDLSLALFFCYEALYCGVTDGRWEWDPGLQTFRAELEQTFERRLRDEIAVPISSLPLEVASLLEEMIQAAREPSLSRFLVEVGTLGQFCEFFIHRPVHQSKGADPYALEAARLTRESLATFERHVEQHGSGDDGDVPLTMYGDVMTALGLDVTYGSYVDVLSGVTLDSVNVISMFDLHPRWRTAFVGHLTAFEMLSVGRSRGFRESLLRFGIGQGSQHSFDAGRTTVGHRPSIARDQLVALARAEPELVVDLLFGSAVLVTLERRFTAHLLGAWAGNRSSLVERV
ncbi:MAG: iron-containing redox enzyme family protein [Acidimicrobiales bacterium]